MTLRRMFVCVGMSLVTLAAPPLSVAQLFAPAAPVEKTVVDATNVLSQSMAMQSGIPQSLLAESQGIVIVPGMVRGAFVIGAQFGRGVLLTRGPGGAWQAPRMLTLTGGSIGYQIGVQSTDLILVFRTPQSVANLLRGTMKIGVDASAAAGPVGRQASAGTDLRLQAEILSYSRARGAFVGVSIDGSVISMDPGADAAYYQPPGMVPASALALVQALTAYSTAQVPAPAPAPVAVAAAPPVASTPAPVMPAPPAAAPGEFESIRAQVDASSRALSPILDETWRNYLALPPEVYVPNGVPNPQALQQVILRYDLVSQRPDFAPLASRPEFQETLRGLWKLGELQVAQGQPLHLPPPPTGVVPR